MVRSVNTFFINGESFINYCSDNDFNYTIYIGQKCKVLKNGKCFIGTLYEVDSNKNTFSIKQNNEEIIEINCADVEEIFSEEEIGRVNQNLVEVEAMMLTVTYNDCGKMFSIRGWIEKEDLKNTPYENVMNTITDEQLTELYRNGMVKDEMDKFEENPICPECGSKNVVWQ